MQLRDHIWAFGNLGHHSGLPVILEHIDHDNSGIRSAVISALRKLPPEHTNQHLMYALYRDEHAEVKAAVVNVFVERHQHLSDSVVQGLEHALWHAPESETLDSSIIELLENHGDHPKAVYLRKRRSAIHRRKRALFPFLRPREFALGPSKRWVKTYGGKWLGAESVIQFVNQVKLRIGIFGGNFENLVQPLRPINLISKVIKFAKDVLSRVKDWKWLIDKIKKIQQSLGRLTVVDDVFKKVIAALDNIFDIVGGITKYFAPQFTGKL
ncbi:hypothetical protein OS493_032212 [Desmophyllum pertusum]|uniref:HEAT repeat domain-containing protein n=1 Tax=Desmophyllum pertusum TaxID=174260 RepID=A0A9X0D780_9CNID|nr:hypothetical protein OS493_032212 [Desmophyllum pertusum]